MKFETKGVVEIRIDEGDVDWKDHYILSKGFPDIERVEGKKIYYLPANQINNIIHFVEHDLPKLRKMTLGDLMKWGNWQQKNCCH